MSIKLMSLVWDIAWPTQSQLVIALKLADYANDDGEKIFPARETLAQKAHCSETTVKSALRAFRNCGLLRVVHDGGNGPRDTTIYQLNVDLLHGLADGSLSICGSSDTLEIDGDFSAVADTEDSTKKGSTKGAEKGSISDPLPTLRGQSEGLRGQPAPEKGVNGRPQSIKESPNRLISAPERASDEGARAPAARKNTTPQAFRPWFTITRQDSSFDAWIDHMHGLGELELAEAAVRAGQLQARCRWPKEGELPRVSDEAMGSLGVNRMVGEPHG